MIESNIKVIKFFNKNFLINNQVHLPRKSTEFIATYYIDFINKLKKKLIVADIGTGSGVLAINIALDCKEVDKIYATDLFSEALKIAKLNIEKYNLENKIELHKGDLFKPIISKKIDVIIANLPFADDEKLKNLQADYANNEPITGIYGGSSGFELYEKLFAQLKNYKYFSNLKGVWIYCSAKHKSKVMFFRRTLFNKFKMKIIKDKYKEYIHTCFYK
jgi:release factor glutamine methyltransferase